jgi:polysaccharide biosynthesis transport protein
VTLADILKYMRAWWWILLIVPLLAGTAGYVGSRVTTPTYQSTATLLVETGQPGSSTHSDIQASERLSRTFSQLLTGREVLDETIAREGLNSSASSLRGRVSVSFVRDTQLIRVSVRSSDPAQAAAIANTLSEVFVENITERQQSASIMSRSELAANLDRVGEQVEETSLLISQLQAGPDVESPASQAEIRRLESLLSHYERTFVSLLELDQRLALSEAQANARIYIVETATPSTGPVAPRTMLNTALAAILGLLTAAGLVTLLGYLDDTVKVTRDVSDVMGRPALGSVPVHSQVDTIESITAPGSVVSEAYRGLRTNIQFSAIDRSITSLIVTSSHPGEGKSTTAANIAVVMAQGGQDVILLDADLRRPSVHHLFTGISNRRGLSNLLLFSRDAPVEDFIQTTAVPRLRILSTGPLPSNPPDLMNSARIGELLEEIKGLADFVVIDTPPLSVSDALLLSRWTDGAILVAQSGSTRASDLLAAREQIERVGGSLLGVVLNRVPIRSRDYYQHYGYYGVSSGEPEPGKNGSVKTSGGWLRGSLFARRGKL